MKKALIGAGGFANEVKAHMKDFNMVCFVDDAYYIPNDKNIKPLSDFDVNEYEVLIVIGDPIVRETIVNKLPKEIQKDMTWRELFNVILSIISLPILSNFQKP